MTDEWRSGTDAAAGVVGYGTTDRGPVRPINEDCMEVDLALGVFIVADGMGGHNAGEVASRLASDTIRGFLKRTNEVDEFTWPFGIDPRLSYDANRLLTAVKLANRRVFRAGESRDEYTGMGTTVVAVVAGRNRAAYAAVGDSRIYSFVDGRLEQLTRDESWLAALGGEPGVDAGTVGAHPMRHVLTNVIGARDDVEAQVGERDLAPAERLVLCTDGVHGALDDARIADILAHAGTARAASEMLVASALARGATDNVTAVVVDNCTDGASASGRTAAAGSTRAEDF
jgi:PPM family protein phosphatase